jgi:hypothetical protein
LEQETAEQQNNELQNVEGWFRSRSASACAACRSVLSKIDRIHSFDIRNSLFGIRNSFFAVCFPIKLAASGGQRLG